MHALLLIVTLCAPQPVLPSVQEIIQEEGQFAFTDGSSVFQFFEDGSFVLQPLSVSGREIEGTWVLEGDNLMHITGT